MAVHVHNNSCSISSPFICKTTILKCPNSEFSIYIEFYPVFNNQFLDSFDKEKQTLYLIAFFFFVTFVTVMFLHLYLIILKGMGAVTFR